MSINKAILIGRVGKEPEVKHIDNNRTVANFSLATSETYKDKDGKKQETTTWHSIVIWGKLAEVVEKYVHKGDQLYLEGKITTRSWEKDGTKHYMTEIVCNAMQMLGGKKSDNPNRGEYNIERPDADKGESDLRGEFDMMLDNESSDIPF